jgi:HAD superfamily hydrolase (TIGR01509 family)
VVDGDESNGRRSSWPPVDAAIFDTDGVITRTATVHSAAWKSLFDDFLRSRLVAGDQFEPFTDADYRRYVDGMPRYDGVTRFLASRGIELPHGDPADPPGDATVCALGNRKNEAFLAELERSGVEAFDSTAAFVRALRATGVRTAAISASENAGALLASAGVADLFDERVDGIDAAELALAGKPDPAIFEEAARRLGVLPGRTAVVEDALAGVAAGKAGGFVLVVGIDRTGHRRELADAGADVVVADLADLRIERDGRWALVSGSSAG